MEQQVDQVWWGCLVVAVPVDRANDEGWPHDCILAPERAMVCPEKGCCADVDGKLQELALLVEVQARRWPGEGDGFKVAADETAVGVQVALVKLLLSDRLL
jgi:hypothetical protein